MLIRPGSPISGPEALFRNLWFFPSRGQLRCTRCLKVQAAALMHTCRVLPAGGGRIPKIPELTQSSGWLQTALGFLNFQRLACFHKREPGRSGPGWAACTAVGGLARCPVAACPGAAQLPAKSALQMRVFTRGGGMHREFRT